MKYFLVLQTSLNKKGHAQNGISRCFPDVQIYRKSMLKPYCLQTALILYTGNLNFVIVPSSVEKMVQKGNFAQDFKDLICTFLTQKRYMEVP